MYLMKLILSEKNYKLYAVFFTAIIKSTIWRKKPQL